MTRMELAYKDSPILREFISPAELICFYCPHDILVDWPDLDKESQKTSEHSITVGCRGITCRMCWNEEVGEQND
jgi:hypothetical protein